jgi:hypothetical protein
MLPPVENGTLVPVNLNRKWAKTWIINAQDRLNKGPKSTSAEQRWL